MKSYILPILATISLGASAQDFSNFEIRKVHVPGTFTIESDKSSSGNLHAKVITAADLDGDGVNDVFSYSPIAEYPGATWNQTQYLLVEKNKLFTQEEQEMFNEVLTIAGETFRLNPEYTSLMKHVMGMDYHFDGNNTYTLVEAEHVSADILDQLKNYTVGTQK